MTVDVCPKRMVFGPCGGVRPAGGCELDAALPCPWADPDRSGGPLPVRGGTDPPRPRRPDAPGGLLDTATRRPVVLSDLCVPPYDVTTLREVAERLSRHSDALLVPEHHDNPDFPPAMMAAELHRAGARPWITLTCRDRNRVVLEQELDGPGGPRRRGRPLRDRRRARARGASRRHRGLRPRLDPPRPPGRPGRAGRERRRLARGAARGPRAAALAEKQRAGASLVVVNHVRGADALATFLDRARAAGVDLPVIAGVAVYTDEPLGARAGGPARARPRRRGDRAGPRRPPTPRRRASRRRSTRPGRCSRCPASSGVNLSGVGSSAGWVPAADIKAEVGRRLAAERVTAAVVIPVRDRVEVAGDRSRTAGPAGWTRSGPTGADTALEAEFDTVAAWTEDAVAELGEDHAIPAACRGSGRPADLAWLAEGLDLHDDDRFLDAGSGLGGPTAWLTREYAARWTGPALLAEPMPHAAAASHRLFGRPAVAAWTEHLPLPDDAVDAAWCLGVLDTADDGRALLARAAPGAAPGRAARSARSWSPGASSPRSWPPTRFPTDVSLQRDLAATGFRVHDRLDASSLPDAPPEWSAARRGRRRRRRPRPRRPPRPSGGRAADRGARAADGRPGRSSPCCCARRRPDQPLAGCRQHLGGVPHRPVRRAGARPGAATGRAARAPRPRPRRGRRRRRRPSRAVGDVPSPPRRRAADVPVRLGEHEPPGAQRLGELGLGELLGPGGAHPLDVEQDPAAPGVGTGPAGERLELVEHRPGPGACGPGAAVVGHARRPAGPGSSRRSPPARAGRRGPCGRSAGSSGLTETAGTTRTSTVGRSASQPGTHDPASSSASRTSTSTTSSGAIGPEAASAERSTTVPGRGRSPPRARAVAAASAGLGPATPMRHGAPCRASRAASGRATRWRRGVCAVTARSRSRAASKSGGPRRRAAGAARGADGSGRGRGGPSSGTTAARRAVTGWAGPSGGPAGGRSAAVGLGGGRGRRPRAAPARPRRVRASGGDSRAGVGSSAGGRRRFRAGRQRHLHPDGRPGPGRRLHVDPPGDRRQPRREVPHPAARALPRCRGEAGALVADDGPQHAVRLASAAP